MNQDYSDRFI